jgi:hypothetical protein
MVLKYFLLSYLFFFAVLEDEFWLNQPKKLQNKFIPIRISKLYTL